MEKNQIMNVLSIILSFIKKNKEFVLILFFSFLVRLFLLDRNSYWLDELYSVYRYGIMHDTVFDAIRDLAKTSVHPPLYQFILYYWMKIFGHTEIATRLLSTIYVILSVVFLYLFAKKAASRRVAIASSLLYVCSYSILYYSLETRSYAQSLCFSTMSSLALAKFLENLKGNLSWKIVFINKHLVLLAISNLLMLFTHYYNIFFVFAQAVFMFFFFWRFKKNYVLVQSLLKTAGVFSFQLLLFLIIWGYVIFNALSRFQDRGRYIIDAAPTHGPLSIFFNMVLRPNYTIAFPVLIVIFIFLAFISWRKLIKSRRMSNSSVGFVKNALFFYAITCSFVPCIGATLCFYVASFEKYSARYFVFCIPPLSILIVILLEKLVSAFDYLLCNSLKIQVARHYVKHAFFYGLILTSVISLPKGYRAVMRDKADWRGVASRIVDIIEKDDAHKYIIYETTFRSGAYTLDYYFKRKSDYVRVFDTISTSNERRSRYSFERHEDEIEKHDYLIVAFPHHRERGFPKALEALGNKYELYFRNTDKVGRGFIVYKIGI